MWLRLTVKLLVSLGLLAAVGLAVLVAQPGLPNDFRSSLQNAEDLELVSLGNEDWDHAGPDSVAGRPNLGIAKLSQADRSLVLDKLDEQIRWARINVSQAGCHYPHHIVRSRKEQAEVSICYQCANFYAHRGDKLVAGGALSGSKDFLNGVFARYGVKIPPTERF